MVGRMDPASIASAMIGAQAGRVQLAVAGKMLQMDAAHGQAIANMIEAAQQNIDSLGNVAAGVGGNLDVRA